MSFFFQELSGSRAQGIAQHLSACKACRIEFDRLRSSQDCAAPAAQPDGIDVLLGKLRSWQLRVTGDALKRRVVGELAPYLGKAGADTLLRPVQDDGRDLLTNVAPLLALFLGRRAAASLVSRVVEKTIVGNQAV